MLGWQARQGRNVQRWRSDPSACGSRDELKASRAVVSTPRLVAPPLCLRLQRGAPRRVSVW